LIDETYRLQVKADHPMNKLRLNFSRKGDTVRGFDALFLLAEFQTEPLPNNKINWL